MTHEYRITGMTCSSCESKVKSALSQIKGITSVEVSKENKSVRINMKRHIHISEMQNALEDRYKLLEPEVEASITETKSWIVTYKPVVLIFIYVFSVSSVIEMISISFDPMRWMRHFMAGFFLTFSFFKMLNIKGFKDSYRMYDVIARKIPNWGYVYAFMELLLGVAYLTNFAPFITNIVTLSVMSVSIIGVLQTVLNKKSIKCACLGDVFNLPMSTVTIIEDALMIAMSGLMVILRY